MKPGGDARARKPREQRLQIAYDAEPGLRRGCTSRSRSTWSAARRRGCSAISGLTAAAGSAWRRMIQKPIAALQKPITVHGNVSANSARKTHRGELARGNRDGGERDQTAKRRSRPGSRKCARRRPSNLRFGAAFDRHRRMGFPRAFESTAPAFPLPPGYRPEAYGEVQGVATWQIESLKRYGIPAPDGSKFARRQCSRRRRTSSRPCAL